MIFFVLTAIAVRAFSLSKKKAHTRIVRLTHELCKVLLKVLNLRCRFEDMAGLATLRDRPLLLLPNHISYVDVIVINAHIPSVFVTSREIEETPVLGWITRAAGCAFVERRNIWQVQDDVVRLAGLLNEGRNVTLFPEGSTSAGDGLMEFKRTLLESAVRSRCLVLPLCLKYERVDERAYDASNRDQVAWYGEMTFFPHLWRLMSTKSIDVRLSVLGEVAFREHKSRKRIAREVKARITERFHAG